jgi:hypothetical protein
MAGILNTARDLERLQRGRGIEAGQSKGGGEDHDRERLELKKTKHHRRKIAGPVFAQLLIAAVLNGMVTHHAAIEMGAKAQAPQRSQRGD